jgi:hypothetical protein
MIIRIIFLQLIISFSLFAKENNKFSLDNTKAVNIDDISKNNNISKSNKKTNEKNEKDEKKDKKLKFSYKPSFIAVGYDFFSTLYKLITETQDNTLTNVSYIDIRFKLNTDFNRIITDISFGYLHNYSELLEKNENSTKKSFFINPNIYYNFLKKNSERNIIYAGGGFNFSRTKYDYKNTKYSYENFYETYYHIWFNAEAGCKTKIISVLHMGISLKFNFLNFQVISNSDFSKTRSVSFEPFLYGFGPYNASYSIEFSIYLFLNINLFDDIKVIRRESYLEI